ncbi:MAG: adenine phosphoribosyltransferase [delta proteobacterium ML8_F1]|nr:MAG: adenine phosphoribosyltransferase [delta proteobacterium ML8_F1]
MNLKEKIRVIEDFPVKGISFKDITTILTDPEAFDYGISEMIKAFGDVDYDVIVAPEARGFIIGAPMALRQHKGFVPIRKPGKLPAETLTFTYELEYGADELQVHVDAITPGLKVLVVDDLLATGGTVKAVKDMVQKLGGEVVGMGFLIELTGLKAREMLQGIRVESIVQYEF